jgi:iron complex transport system substrate-binding protein
VTAGELPALDAVHPDLILGSDSGQGRLYDDLSRIAPTVIIASAGGQWKLNLRLVGEALGRTNDAEQLLTDYDAEAAQARRAIRGRPRVAVVRMTSSGLRFAKRTSFAGTILADARVKQATAARGTDVLLLSEPPRAKTFVDGPYRVVRVDEELWWGSGGALAARAALRQLRAALGR